MNKKYLALSVLVLVIAMTGIYRHYRTASQVDLGAVLVQAVLVTQKNVPQEVHAIGTLVGRSVDVSPEVSGHIKQVLFHDGAEVKKGDVLMQLDDEIFKAKADSANTKLQYSLKNFNRMIFLGKKGVITKQAIDQAEADLKESKAQAIESNVMLKKMQLVAPFDGSVSKSKVNPGDFVNIGQEVVTLTDTKHLRIEYNLAENLFAKLKTGQDVRVSASAYPAKTFNGKVSYISPTINIDNRSIALYAEVPNENGELAAGMFVDVIQTLGSNEKMVTVPAKSLVPTLDGEQVYKIVDGKAYAVTVSVGNRSNDQVEIIRGLSSGDKVITDGQMKVKDGALVKTKS